MFRACSRDEQDIFQGCSFLLFYLFDIIVVLSLVSPVVYFRAVLRQQYISFSIYSIRIIYTKISNKLFLIVIQTFKAQW
jgi:hypothetical protein